MIAWIPLIILWCGIGEKSKVVIIVIAAFFPIMINTLNGVESTPSGYIEVARLYKLSNWQTFLKVYLPHALPSIFVGLKLSLGVSWMAVVASELIAATSGIGYRMSDARSLMRSDIVIVCMLIIGLVGIVMDKCLTFLFRVLTPWVNKNGGRANG
jgi:sulfonate transport system permease protein